MAKIKALRLGLNFGKETIFSDVSFSCLGGEGVAVRGPNGSGKSMLLNVLAGGLKPSQGALQMVSPKPSHPSLVPAEIHHDLALSVKTYLSIWGGDSAAIDEQKEIWNLDELWPQKMGKLSQGQRRRVLLGCGFSRESSFYLLDEPTTNIDEPSLATLKKSMMQKMEAGACVVMATHDSLQFEGQWSSHEMQSPSSVEQGEAS